MDVKALLKEALQEFGLSSPGDATKIAEAEAKATALLADKTALATENTGLVAEIVAMKAELTALRVGMESEEKAKSIAAAEALTAARDRAEKAAVQAGVGELDALKATIAAMSDLTALGVIAQGFEAAATSAANPGRQTIPAPPTTDEVEKLAAEIREEVAKKGKK